MNDYAMGAVEALHWAIAVVQSRGSTRTVLRELEAARDDLMAGVSVDFRRRLKPAVTPAVVMTSAGEMAEAARVRGSAGRSVRTQG